jgi:hypothetical protein
MTTAIRATERKSKARLTRRERKVLDALYRQFAKNLAADSGLPFDQALEGITRLHERGYLAFKYDAVADRFSFEPTLPEGGQS